MLPWGEREREREREALLEEAWASSLMAHVCIGVQKNGSQKK